MTLISMMVMELMQGVEVIRDSNPVKSSVYLTDKQMANSPTTTRARTLLSLV